MAKRTKEQRIADRGAKRQAEGRELSNRQQAASKAASSQQSRQERRTENKPKVEQKVDNASNYQFDQYRKGSVNTSEVRNLRQQGQSRADIQQAAADSGLRISNKTQKRFDSWDASAAKRAEAKERAQQQQVQPKPVVPAPVVERTTQQQNTPSSQEPSSSERTQTGVNQSITIPQPGQNAPGISIDRIPSGTGTNVNPVQDNDMTQTVQQDNDITTDITGNNNYVNNMQDNSIRQYGGDNRQFTYVGGQNGGNPALDTPATAATLGGYWDVNDSPAKQAAFVDMHSTLNRDMQKAYANTGHIAQGAISRAAQNQTINTNALDQRIYDREQYSRAKSDMMGMNIFGDMYKAKPPAWQSPERQTEVEKPDFEKMYDTYTDF